MNFLLLDTILGLVHMLIIGVYFLKIHGAKNKLLSLTLLSVIVSLIMSAIDFINISQSTRAIIVHLAMFLMFSFLYKGKLSKKIITFFVYFLLSFACDFLVFTLTGAFGIKNELLFTIVMNGMMFILLSLVLTIAAKFMTGFGKIYDKHLYLVFILIPITQFGFITVLIVLMHSMGIIADSYKSISAQGLSIIISALLIFTLIADIVFLDVTRKAAENFRDKERLQTLEFESKMNYKYYEDLQANTDKMRKYRHDTNNIIQSIYTLLDNPDKTSSEAAIKLTETLEAEINSININHYCSHPIVNAVLSDKEKDFTKSNISCKFNVNIPQNISIGGFDLCRVFSNILDNALEACGKGTNNEVSADASIIDGYLYIKVRNPIYITEKSKGNERGNGLEIIKQITDKYSGETIVSTENGIFETLVTLKCEQ